MVALAVLAVVPSGASASGPVPPKEVAEAVMTPSQAREFRGLAKFCRTKKGKATKRCQSIARIAGPVCDFPWGCGWEFGRKNSVRLVKGYVRAGTAAVCGIVGKFNVNIGIGCVAVAAGVGDYVDDVGRAWLGGQCLRVLAGLTGLTGHRNPCG
jgi:hypothetical protein